MLVPAIRYKDILLKKFSEVVYSEDYFLYYGYPYGFDLPEIKDEECRWQWAVVDKSKATEEDSVIGYISYRVDTLSDMIHQFGLYSFDKGNLIVGHDLFKKLEELISKHHRVEWRAIDCNPILNSYIRFCNNHNGNIIHLHDVTKDRDGNYIGSYIFEIINPDK